MWRFGDVDVAVSDVEMWNEIRHIAASNIATSHLHIATSNITTCQNLPVDVDVAVIGGGVVGLAAAAAIAEGGASVCLLERETRLGHGTSTRNSGVIHAGLYYRADSLKARLCVEGRDRLYAYCAQHGVPGVRCGKLVVAHDAGEVEALGALLARAHGNGVTASLVDQSFIRRREPHVTSSVAAIWSPDSGIVEAESLVRTLSVQCRERGVAIVVDSPVVGAEPAPDGVTIVTPHERIVTAQVVNAAGLYADHVSRMLGGRAFTIHPCRGQYVELAPSRRHWLNGLVYPLPHGVGLGVHLVKTTWGSVLLGPTTDYQESRDDYEGGRLPTEAFLAPAQRLLPAVTLGDLQPGSTGIRAKLHGAERSFADFLVERDPVNPRIIQAAGIDSPGLTSCLAIGALVGRIVQRG
jgi:L-2-hydroxyglutarate oxidase LhgO